MDPDTMDKLISSTSLLTEQLSNLQDENAKSNCVQDYLRTIKLPNLSCDFPKGRLESIYNQQFFYFNLTLIKKKKLTSESQRG